jgi:hypothetical protein
MILTRTAAALSAILLAGLATSAATAGGFTPEIFETFVESNMGTDGKPVYYYSTGTVREFPGGALLATIEGVDMARLLKRDGDGTVHKASRKMYIMRDPTTGEVIEQIGGRPNNSYFYPYQYMIFKHEGDRLTGRSTQGAGQALRSVDIGSVMEARKVGDVTVFSAPNYRARPDGTGSYEMYEFWVQPKAAKVNPSTQLTLTLVNWHPIGNGKPVYTHRTSWRVDRYEDLPQSLRDYIETKAPLFKEPPKDMAEIERLQKAEAPGGDITPAPSPAAPPAR